jgi:NADH dehydrogenase
VALAGGEMLPAATTICTIGTQPNALVGRMTIPVERGRIVVDSDLSVRDTPGMWALGDCALVPNARDGKFAPATAQFAVREARHLASNLLAAVTGAPTRAFSYQARGEMAAIGHRKGVAQLFGIPLSGLPAWLLWRAYYLSQMPTLGRKVRIFVEWTWGMFISVDVTHLRFARSHEIDEARAVPSTEVAQFRDAA